MDCILCLENCNDKYLQFYSIRKSARKPEYTNLNIYDVSSNYCLSVDDLPA